MAETYLNQLQTRTHFRRNSVQIPQTLTYYSSASATGTKVITWKHDIPRVPNGVLVVGITKSDGAGIPTITCQYPDAQYLTNARANTSANNCEYLYYFYNIYQGPIFLRMTSSGTDDTTYHSVSSAFFYGSESYPFQYNTTSVTQGGYQTSLASSEIGEIGDIIINYLGTRSIGQISSNNGGTCISDVPYSAAGTDVHGSMWITPGTGSLTSASFTWASTSSAGLITSVLRANQRESLK